MEMLIIDDVRLFNFTSLEEMEVGFSNHEEFFNKINNQE
jgi:hypothetical protein